MNRLKLLSLLLVLVLCACAVTQPGDENEGNLEQNIQTEPENNDIAEPLYGFEDVTQARQFVDESSGRVYASYNYRMPMMRLNVPDGLSEKELTTAQRNAEVFNAQMQLLMDEAVAFGEEMAQELEGGYFSMNSEMSAADEKVMSVWQTGQILTVFVNGYFYSGGVHPYVYTDSYTFDLTVGQFIDPAQIGDDPEAFRVQAAALLVVKAESLGEEYTSGYWDDYAEIISNWNDTTVLFDDTGMTVIFSAYELGPYAMGPVELQLTYEELADVIGQGGLEHLGVAPGEMQE